MAIVCLSKDIFELREKLGNIIVGYNEEDKPIYAKDLKAQGAMAVLLKDAIKPNLVQTLEHTPALIHGGPFANIAHGCNSIRATKLALKLSDYTITESGFGADLGAEKFLDIKCKKFGIKPDAVVLVTTIKALKYHGGVEKENIQKEKSEICYDEREECTLKHLTKSGMERFWEYTIRSGGGFFMIRENNTLEWQEIAEQKRMTQRRIIQRRERARRRKRKVWRIRGLLLLFGCLLLLGGVRRFRQNPIQRYAKANGISMDQYPEELLSLYERNNETETFVEEYPLKKEEEPEIDLSDLSSASEVPLLLQWDQRWGYHRYAGEVMGLSGCGPTALSMVAIFMTGDITKNPRWVADFASQNGYAVDGSGTAWSLMLEGARQIGLSSKEIPVERERVENNLQAGNLIIALMGPGEFTSNGHFIVLTGLQNGRLKINDPNSRKNSEKTWDIDQVLEQTKAVWVYYK